MLTSFPPPSRHAGPEDRPGPEDREAIIEVRTLGKRYGDHVAVDDVAFTVLRGEIFGILGPNGAGKTTTLEMIEGLRRPDRGTAIVAGLDVTRAPRAVRAKIGVQLQATALFPELSVRDNLRLLAAVYPRAMSPDDLLDEVNLTDQAHTPLGALSGGQQQRLSLAAALVNDPQVVFLDEPTTGLDPQARRSLWALIGRLRDDGKTIVLTTHYMEEAEVLCDRVAIMTAGRIVALDAPARLIECHGKGMVIDCAFDAAVDPGGLAQLTALRHVDRSTVADSAAPRDRFVLRTDDLEATMVALLRFADLREVKLTEFRVHRPGLEDVFLAIAGRAITDDSGPLYRQVVPLDRLGITKDEHVTSARTA